MRSVPRRSVEELIECHSRFPWREPVVLVYGGGDGLRWYGCRVCMAVDAVRNPPERFVTVAEVEGHMRREHPWLHRLTQQTLAP